MAIQADEYRDNLKVTVRGAPGESVVELTGELDLATAANLREALLPLDLDGGIRLEIDLRALTFLGSPGIGVLVAACKRVRTSGGRFSVSCDHGFVRRTLEIAGLVDYLEVHDGEESHPNQDEPPSTAARPGLRMKTDSLRWTRGHRDGKRSSVTGRWCP